MSQGSSSKQVQARRESVKPAGAVVFTGPDGLANHRTSVLEPGYVGHSDKSRESTGNVEYLWRPCSTVSQISDHSYVHLYL